MNTNHVELIGHLTGNLCLHYLEAEFAVAKFEIAVIRNLHECHCCDVEYDFFDVKAFGELAEMVCNEFALYRRIRVEGCLRLEAQETDSGIVGCCVSVIADTVDFYSNDEDGYSDICIECQEKESQVEALKDSINPDSSPFD